MKPRVLVVDDEPEYLQLVEFNLAGQGFEVVRAVNGLQALHKARCEMPHVIVLDLMLPDLDGFSVCEILRAQPSTKEVPVIILSALNGQATLDRSAKLGVSRCFTKGVDLKGLVECVRVAFNQHQARTQARVLKEEHPSGRVVD